MEPRERLLNLVQLLLHVERPLTFGDIRDRMGEAYEGESATVRRRFERDKESLRERGIPIETVTDPWETDHAYTIDPDRYYLPEIAFETEEIVALFIAAHGDPLARRAFGKLAWGTDQAVIADLLDAAPPGVDASARHLPEVARAVMSGRRITFDYRRSDGDASRRDLDAWGLVFSRGSWYVIGNDRTVDDVRAFRLTRITSAPADAGEAAPPPDGFDAREHLRAGPWGVGEPDLVARVAFSPKVAAWALQGSEGARAIEEGADGWTIAEVPASRGPDFLAWVRHFGSDAELLAPEELRSELVRSLEAQRV